MIEYTVKVDNDGTKRWFLNGKQHREDGTKLWFLNGKQHREDGPAVEYADGSKFWWLNGKRHREDGPAIERSNGTKHWYLNGKEYSEEVFLKKTEAANTKISEEIDSMTREEDSLSLDDLKEVLNYIRLQRNEAPDVYYKISKVIRERESLSPKEMTVEEIEKQLGHTIKVVK